MEDLRGASYPWIKKYGERLWSQVVGELGKDGLQGQEKGGIGVKVLHS